MRKSGGLGGGWEVLLSSLDWKKIAGGPVGGRAAAAVQSAHARATPLPPAACPAPRPIPRRRGRASAAWLPWEERKRDPPSSRTHTHARTHTRSRLKMEKRYRSRSARPRRRPPPADEGEGGRAGAPRRFETRTKNITTRRGRGEPRDRLSYTAAPVGRAPAGKSARARPLLERGARARAESGSSPGGFFSCLRPRFCGNRERQGPPRPSPSFPPPHTRARAPPPPPPPSLLSPLPRALSGWVKEGERRAQGKGGGQRAAAGGGREECGAVGEGGGAKGGAGRRGGARGGSCAPPAPPCLGRSLYIALGMTLRCSANSGSSPL